MLDATIIRANLLRIDMATMARGLTRLESETSEKPELSLIVPLSYISLRHHPSRQAIPGALDKARQAALTGII